MQPIASTGRVWSSIRPPFVQWDQVKNRTQSQRSGTTRFKAPSRYRSAGHPARADPHGPNRNDVTQLLPLIEAIPPIRGKRGRPLSKPVIVQADRGYVHDKYRKPLHAAGIATQIARRGEPHGSGLGKTRWVVEHTFAWLHNFRRLRIRFERLAAIHEAFMKIAACIICWRHLQKSFCWRFLGGRR